MAFEDLDVWKRSAALSAEIYLELKASCAELRTQTYIGIKIGYITTKKGKQWIQETKELSAMLTNLICSIDQKL